MGMRSRLRQWLGARNHQGNFAKDLAVAPGNQFSQCSPNHFFISLGKFMAAKALVEFTKLPFFLVLNTIDGIYYRKFTDFDNLKFVVNGRKDRNDWQDIEPMVLLDTDTFIKIND
jgi:hypothetical protein